MSMSIILTCPDICTDVRAVRPPVTALPTARSAYTREITMRDIPQRQGFCEVSRYGQDQQCLKRPTHETCVESLHDEVIRTGIDAVCAAHSGRILDLKRALYVSYGLGVPKMWVRAKKGE